MKRSVRKQQKWIQERVNYCIEYGIHPGELGIPAFNQHLYNLIVTHYDMKVAALHTTHEIAKQVPGRSTSVDTIKNRTGGRNRKERRGS